MVGSKNSWRRAYALSAAARSAGQFEPGKCALEVNKASCKCARARVEI
jgi:hypothetical protein